MQKLLWQLPERFALQTIVIIFYSLLKKVIYHFKHTQFLLKYI